MKTEIIGIREAKMHLSRYLKSVGQGNEVILTDRGVPVGKIVPLSAGECPLENRLKTLEQKGILDRQPACLETRPPLPIPVPMEIAQRFLQEDREHG
jgi:prevent-host-death family protein